MKLLITSDDYGISYGVTEGILHGIRNGVITETGLFTNMPCSKFAAEAIRNEFPNFCLGEDMNLVAGKPVTDPEKIPTLVQKNGEFMTSTMHRNLDKETPNHIKYEEAFLEMENQLRKFVEYFGKKPAYIQGHSYGTVETHRAMEDLAKREGIPLLSQILKENSIPGGAEVAPWNIKPFSIDMQLKAYPLEYFRSGKLTYLEDALENNGIAHIHVHAGFVDEDLCRVSSYSFIRMRELDFLTSEDFRKWITENDVELIDCRDLCKEEGMR